MKVPPETKIFLLTCTNYPLYQDVNIIEPVAANSKRGLLLARSIINKERESHVSVLNLSDEVLKLKSGDTIGQVCPVEKGQCKISGIIKSD